jgi:hypothetical protein
VRRFQSCISHRQDGVGVGVSVVLCPLSWLTMCSPSLYVSDKILAPSTMPPGLRGCRAAAESSGSSRVFTISSLSARLTQLNKTGRTKTASSSPAVPSGRRWTNWEAPDRGGETVRVQTGTLPSQATEIHAGSIPRCNPRTQHLRTEGTGEKSHALGSRPISR